MISNQLLHIVIEIEEIVEFIDGHSKPLRDSKLILQAGYLQKIGHVKSDDIEIHIRGISLRVTSTSNQPCEINIRISKPFPGHVLFGHCTCDGGATGKCKHAVAILRVLMSSTTVESWTCTEGPCSWQTSMKAKQDEIHKPVQLTEFCHFVKKDGPSLPSIPDFFNSKVFSAIFEKLPENSSFMKEWKGRQTRDFVQNVNHMRRSLVHFPNALVIYDEKNERSSLEDLIAKGRSMNFELSIEDIKKIEQCTRRQASNPNWFNFRKGRITGSTIGFVMKMRSTTSNKTVRNKICYPLNTKFSTAATRYGCNHEKDAIQLYCQLQKSHRNLKVSPSGLFINHEYPFLGASPDGIVSCECCGERILEIKCPYCLTGDKKMADLQMFSTSTTSRGTSSDGLFLKIDHHYYYQIQLQMLCVGLDEADFMVWSEAETPHMETIQRNKDTLKSIIEKSEYFFYNVIVPELLAKHFTREDAMKPPKVNKKRKTI